MKITLLKSGTYRWENDEIGGGVVDVDVRETKDSLVLRLVRNTCRYSPGHIDMLFAKSDKAIVKKSRGPHAVNFIDGCDDWFCLYPYRVGIPFAFELKEVSE